MLFLVSMFLLHSPGVAFAQTGQIVEDIQLHGNRRIPKETVENKMFTRRGDIYDEIALQRDLHALWNSGYFEDVRIEREQTAKGWIVHVYVRERPTIRTIDYHGLNSVSTSDVLERFKKAKVPLTVESAYDPTKIIRAKVVLQQLLAEHGRQFATVGVQLQQVPPSSVAVTFNVKEGPKIKVGVISFAGNKHVSTRDLRRAMKNLKPVGVPNSIFLENLFARTFDASKLEEDAQRVQDAYQQRGYYKAVVQDPSTHLHDQPGGILPVIPVPPFRKGEGKSMDIAMSVEEGDKYKLKAINFRNNRAISNTQFLRSLFPMKEGDTFDTHQVHKGLDNLRKAYEELGYIKYTGVPETIINDEKKELTLNIDIDEGKPFFVRRIEFQGNTTTRDKVIRRELLLQEGQVYNYRLWELSVLRLNQLNYFNTLKAEDDTERKLDEQNGTVDLTVKVSEKGKKQHWPHRRRKWPGRVFRGAQLPNQQFSRSGRNADAPGQRGQPPAGPGVWLHRTLFVRPPDPAWLSGLPAQVRLQSGPAGADYCQSEDQFQPDRAEQSFELQPGQQGIFRYRQLPAGKKIVQTLFP